MRLPIEPKLPDLPVRSVAEMGLKELERVRLILRGGSVIDWRRLHFRNRDEVDRFLRLCGLDLTHPEDEAWARLVLSDAVEYLRRTFSYRVADAVARPTEMHDLFLYASGAKEPHRFRRIACIVLKCMHVMQHIEGRDLLFRLAVSEADLSRMATAKVNGVLAEAREKGLPDPRHQPVGEEPRVVDHQAAGQEGERGGAGLRQDPLPHRDPDAGRHPPVLYFLTQRLFPFNFLVPGQTENTLLPFKSLAARVPALPAARARAPPRPGLRGPRGARRATSSAAAGTRCSTSWWTCRSGWTSGCRRPSSTAASARAASASPWSSSRCWTCGPPRRTSRARTRTPATSSGRS